ncbi:hypothetical protein F5Y11DRAFT_343984 [Daldinia sp. FL1419]|nr:hypothetical protein F5Y11DRAFT_343984 [Daldinia sp. FL1419]
MVRFVGRLRKPKLPVTDTVESQHEDATASAETPIVPQYFNPPVLRNFSYPINVGNLGQLPPFPSPPRAEQAVRDQLGDPSDFSPDSVPRTREAKTLELGSPFSFGSKEEPSPLCDEEDNRDEEFGIGVSSEQLDQESPSREEPTPRKKPRRGTLLSLSSSRTQDSTFPEKSAEKTVSKDKVVRSTKGQSLSDRIFPQTSIITSRLKRNSSGKHKTTASLDASRLMVLPPSSLDRPASSSGVPLIDTTVKSPSITTSYAPSPLVVSQNTSIMPGEIQVSQVTGAMESLEISPINGKKISNDQNQFSHNTLGNTKTENLNDASTELVKHKKKDSKRHWMSQLKSWVTISEPSTQAFKRYKEETYNKAHISLDYTDANAELHSPIGTLPPNVIKPAGSGPDSEEIFRKQTEQRKRMRHSATGSYETHQGSKSTSSRFSTSSSIALGTAREVL